MFFLEDFLVFFGFHNLDVSRLDECLSPDLSSTAGLGGDNMTAAGAT